MFGEVADPPLSNHDLVSQNVGAKVEHHDRHVIVYEKIGLGDYQIICSSVTWHEYGFNPGSPNFKFPFSRWLAIEEELVLVLVDELMPFYKAVPGVSDRSPSGQQRAIQFIWLTIDTVQSLIPLGYAEIVKIGSGISANSP